MGEPSALATASVAAPMRPSWLPALPASSPASGATGSAGEPATKRQKGALEDSGTPTTVQRKKGKGGKPPPTQDVDMTQAALTDDGDGRRRPAAEVAGGATEAGTIASSPPRILR